MSGQPTEASFLKDVASHEMHVLMENGVYRHIRFKRPGTGCMHFDLITYPGHLVYSGDMGCYVFSRLEDMFEFFRTDREHRQMRNGETLAINLGYWSEKLRAVDGGRHNPGAMEFSEAKFRRVINEYRVRWMRECKDRGVGANDRRELWESVDFDVLDKIEDGGQVAMTAAHEFSERIGGCSFRFDDLFEHSFEDFRYHFVWCCYALAWGVQKYDEAKALRESA
jgi:hypothetical protein